MGNEPITPKRGTASDVTGLASTYQTLAAGFEGRVIPSESDVGRVSAYSYLTDITTEGFGRVDDKFERMDIRIGNIESVLKQLKNQISLLIPKIYETHAFVAQALPKLASKDALDAKPSKTFVISTFIALLLLIAGAVRIGMVI